MRGPLALCLVVVGCAFSVVVPACAQYGRGVTVSVAWPNGATAEPLNLRDNVEVPIRWQGGTVILKAAISEAAPGTAEVEMLSPGGRVLARVQAAEGSARVWTASQPSIGIRVMRVRP